MQAFEIRPFEGVGFGANIVGVDLAAPLDERELLRLKDAFNRYSLLVFQGQRLTPVEHIAFTRRFGEIEVHVQSNYHLRNHPEIFVISNLIEDGRLIGGVDCALTWHSDSSYMKIPSLGSMLYAVEVPPVGADTFFACMYQPFDDLPLALKGQILGRRAVHSYLRLQQHQFPERPLTEEQRRRAPPVAHPIAPIHPVTGRRSLFLGGDVIASVEGMAEEEGLEIMREILEFSTRPEYVYRHRWNAEDFVFWDNRCTLHQGSRYDTVNHRRRMHRSTLAGTAAPAM